MAPPPCTVGWVGCGVMGVHMASKLIGAGHTLRVFSRTAAKCEPLLKQGAIHATSPAEATTGSDAVFMMVGNPADVEAVALGPDGVVGSMRAGALLIDCTTSTPSLASKIADAATTASVLYIDAPVSGGDVGAAAGTLSIMCGGSADAMEKATPLLSLMGSKIAHMGAAGAGQHTKMCNQILAANNMIGVTESLLYATRAGLDANAVIGAIGAGAAGSWAVNNLGPRVVSRDFAPGFMIQHMVKDLRIALEEAEAMQLQLPGLQLAQRLYSALERHGHGRDGTQALLLALEETSKYLHEERQC